MDQSTNRKQIQNKKIKKHQIKRFVIVFTYAIIDPWTMMVHFQRASITHRTMVRSYWLSNLAIEAIISGHFKRIDLNIIRANVARIFKD